MDEASNRRSRRAEWEDFEKRQQFEHDLINRKTTWLLSTQTILFAAYGVTLGPAGAAHAATAFREIVACLGAAVAMLMWIGIVALIRSKHLSFTRYRAYFGNPARELPGPLDRELLQWGVNTRNTYLALAPDALLPLAFVVAWLAVWYWAG